MSWLQSRSVSGVAYPPHPSGTPPERGLIGLRSGVGVGVAKVGTVHALVPRLGQSPFLLSARARTSLGTVPGFGRALGELHAIG